MSATNATNATGRGVLGVAVRAAAALVAASSASCGGGKPPPPAPVPAATPPQAAVDAAPDGGAPPAAPATPRAAFARVLGKPVAVDVGPCGRTLVAVTSGEVTATPAAPSSKAPLDAVALGAGDVLVATDLATVTLAGTGLAVFAHVPRSPCGAPAPAARRVAATEAEPLAWADGAMRAWLDVEGRAPGDAYLGRLEGTAPVAEHAHDASWELLFALDAAGTFTLAGEAKRLGPLQIVVVPPGTKHAWTPDPGTTLKAVQLYYPPGPEQRFKALAGAPPAK